MTRTLQLELLLICFVRSTSAFLHLALKLFFFVFSLGHSSPADTHRPFSHHSSEQSLDQGSATNQPNKPQHSRTSPVVLPQPYPALVSKQEEGISATPAPQHSEVDKQPMTGHRDDDVPKTGHSLEMATNEDELVQSSVVPWPLPASANTITKYSHSKLTNIPDDTHMNKIQDETKMVKITTDSSKSLEINDDKDANHFNSSSLKKHMHSIKSLQTNNLHTQTHTPELNLFAKDQQLQEEEKLLLAKIHVMTGDTSPVSRLRTMKRLIPAPGDIDSDTTDPPCQSDIPVDLVDHSLHSIIPGFDTLQEISLAEAEKPLNKELGQNKAEEDV